MKIIIKNSSKKFFRRFSMGKWDSWSKIEIVQNPGGGEKIDFRQRSKCSTKK